MNRRGFTLLETMLASAVASLIVFAGMGLLYTMNRTDRMLEGRSQDLAQLQRMRVVMARAFGALLMSDEPRSGTTAGARGGRVDEVDIIGGVPTARPVDGPGSDQPGADAAKGDGKSEGAGSEGAAKDKFGRPLKPPPPPRIVLSLDTAAQALMRYQPGVDEQPIDVSPQRLELVLHRSPIPQAKLDPLDAPMPVRSRRRSPPTDRAERDAADTSPGAEEDANGAEAEELTPEKEADLPVRAVRGAFELHPQPPQGWRAPGIPQQPASAVESFQRTGLWELWWIPLLPPGTQDTAITTREAVYSGLGKPYLVASDLKYARFTAFFARGRRAELTSTWTGDLPAYIELQAETAGGLKANWMFEVDWATGPEVAKRPDADKPGAADRAAGANGAATPGEAAKEGAPRTPRPAKVPSTDRVGGTN